jgi:hypothetical protein
MLLPEKSVQPVGMIAMGAAMKILDTSLRSNQLLWQWTNYWINGRTYRMYVAKRPSHSRKQQSLQSTKSVQSTTGEDTTMTDRGKELTAINNTRNVVTTRQRPQTAYARTNSIANRKRNRHRHEQKTSLSMGANAHSATRYWKAVNITGPDGLEGRRRLCDGHTHWW